LTRTFVMLIVFFQDYAQMRPGGLHLVDLVFLGGRILREMADLALEEGRVFDAAGHLIR